MQVNLKNDDSARETLSLIRKSLKSDNYSEIEEIKNGIEAQKDVLKQMLYNPDAKARKNAALLMGDLQMSEMAQLIFDVYLKEEKRFVKSSYQYTTFQRILYPRKKNFTIFQKIF